MKVWKLSRSLLAMAGFACGIDATHVSGVGATRQSSAVEVASENGNIQGLPTNGKVPDREMVELTAVADEGFVSSGWSGDVQTLKNPLELVFDQNLALEAVFVPGQRFIWRDFQSLEQWNLNGDTDDIQPDQQGVINVNGQKVLRLTEDLHQAGSAFLDSPITIAHDASFSAFFQFQFSNAIGISDEDGPGADGMVFVISGQPEVAGEPGKGIGYEGIQDSIGLEFDTYNNSEVDPDGNHVALNLNGDIQFVPGRVLSLNPERRRLNDGRVRSVWLDYDGATRRLDLRMAAQSLIRPAEPRMSMDLDLQNIFNSSEVYVGFTSGTGAAGNYHDLLNFRFSNDFDPILLPNYNLELVAEKGKIEVDPVLPTYPEGSVALISAAADPGFVFSSWSGDIDGSDNPLTHVVEGHATIEAVFVEEFELPDVLAGPRVDPNSGHLFYLLSRSTWTAAEKKAVELGGHLVTINDVAENSWVYDQFANFGDEPRALWIGLTDQDEEGNFLWANGEDVNFTKWSSGEPSDSGGVEDWVHMWPGHQDFDHWNDSGNITEADWFRGSDAMIGFHGVVEVDPNSGAEPEIAVNEIANGDTNPDPANLTDFGRVDVGSSNTIREFTISNSGDADLSIALPIEIDGVAAADFSIIADPASTLGPGATSTFKLSFHPSAAGLRTAVVEIGNNDADENPFVFRVSGQGIDRISGPTVAFGRVVFSSDRGTPGEYAIYIMDGVDADGDGEGDGLEALTEPNNAWSDRYPKATADGSHVAYVSNREGNYEVYIMDLEDRSENRLTTTANREIQPVISPDGTQIVFTRYNGKTDVWVMDMEDLDGDGNGDNAVQLTESGWNHSAVWSPDGAKIAFRSDRNISSTVGSQIFVMDADGSNETALTEADHWDNNPFWHPDGGSIVFSRANELRGYEVGDYADLFLIDLDGSNLTNLTQSETEMDIFPAYSPNGERLVFAVAPGTSTGDEPSEIMLMDTGSGTRTPLTSNPAMDWDPSYFATEGENRLVTLFSGSGAELASDPDAEFPTRSPSVSGESLMFDSGPDFDLLFGMPLFGESLVDLSMETLTVEIDMIVTKRQSDTDPLLAVYGSQGGGLGVKFGSDNNGGNAWASRLVHENQVFDDGAYIEGQTELFNNAGATQQMTLNTKFVLRPSEHEVSASFLSEEGQAVLTPEPLDGPLRVGLWANNSLERYQVDFVDIRYTPVATYDLQILINAEVENGELVISWPASGDFVLQSVNNLGGSWNIVDGVEGNSYRTSTDGTSQFFRLVRE